MHLMNLLDLLVIQKRIKESTLWFPYYRINIWKPQKMIHNSNIEQGRRNEWGQWGCISTKTLEKIENVQIKFEHKKYRERQLFFCLHQILKSFRPPCPALEG